MIERSPAITHGSSDAQPLGLWWHFTVGISSLFASLFAWLTRSTGLVEDSWSALAQELTLWLAITGIAIATWLAVSALKRHERRAALLVGAPALLGLVKPFIVFLATLGELLQVLLAD